MPEDGKCPAVLGGPVEESHQLRLGSLGRQSEVTLFRERCIHCRERDLDEVEWLVAFEVPWLERAGDPGAEADRIREAQRRVVAKPGRRERDEIPVWIQAEVVVAVA
jgi:hypothetical protein